jgi:MoaA/NifB/PqqE/SkfB family radical SAM enzyme
VRHLSGSYLVLETTNRCSVACVHCSVGEAAHPHHERTGFVAVPLVRKLLADLVDADARFDVFIPFWLGEPLLHPDFSTIYQEALRAAGEHGVFERIEVHTNATHLTADRVRLALNQSPVPQTWHLTLDATTPETWKRIKGRSVFEDVVANVERLVREKARLAAPWPRLVFQFIVSDRNAQEAARFRAHWEGLCRSVGLPVSTAAQEVPPGSDAVVFFRQLDAPTPGEQERQNRVFRATMQALGVPLPRPSQSPELLPGANTAVCGCFWKSPVIGWDGTLTVCTRDNRLENRLGNISDSPFGALWFDGAVRGWRAQVAAGDYAGLVPCQTCFIPQSSNYSGITPSEIVDFARSGGGAGVQR